MAADWVNLLEQIAKTINLNQNKRDIHQYFNELLARSIRYADFTFEQFFHIFQCNPACPYTEACRSQLVNRSPSILYDTRTSLDKLRLTSTRFVASRPSSPFAVFAQLPQRQHILVTGGFSSLGKSLVRDLLLLGSESGGQRTSNTVRKPDGPLDLPSDQGGIVITILDTRNRSEELDEILRHTPLYHRSKVGFNLPTPTSTKQGLGGLWNSRGAGKKGPIEEEDESSDPWESLSRGGSSQDVRTPPVEFVDPRSAAFSSSMVSLDSFVGKGRLRILLGDSRNTSLLSQILQNRHSIDPSNIDSKAKIPKYSSAKRPSHVQDQVPVLPPISGIFHLAGYEASECVLKNSRDCADLERNGVAALSAALEVIEPDLRPWVVLGDRGNLDNAEVVVRD